MTAENPEPNGAPGGDDLRARYLPVSRKELRRRREAGIDASTGSTSVAGEAADADSSAAPEFTTGSESTGRPSLSAVPVLSGDGLAELRELNQAVGASDDPHRVDPELLKKQQALAARAMQANQERLRQEQAETDRDAEESHPPRPESDIITRKTLRAHVESDEPAEPNDQPIGSIVPIQARGAHGLEIDAIVEHSTRQGARQSLMGWLVIVLALLLIIAVGVVLSFTL